MNTPNYHIHLDLVGGIAGDMFVAAMLDCEPTSVERLKEQVNRLLPKEVGTCELRKGVKAGFSGLHFFLDQKPSAHSAHKHTTYAFIKNLFEQSQLDPKEKTIAQSILHILATAESKIHGQPLEKVHFHEIADWDSVMDIAAIAVILASLQDCTWSHSEVPLGSGLVNTQHGMIPVPAPATLELLTGLQCCDDGVNGERVTPTGAAILRYLHTHASVLDCKGGIVSSVGYGLGTKNLEGRANILRATKYQTDDKQCIEQVAIVEFDIDDMTAEEIATGAECLRSTAGVIDLVITTGRGKKNRAVDVFRLIVQHEYLQQVFEACFAQTSTIGLRYRVEKRMCLQRESSTSFIKQVRRPDGTVTQKMENDALEGGVDLHSRRMQKYRSELGE